MHGQVRASILIILFFIGMIFFWEWMHRHKRRYSLHEKQVATELIQNASKLLHEAEGNNNAFFKHLLTQEAVSKIATARNMIGNDDELSRLTGIRQIAGMKILAEREREYAFAQVAKHCPNIIPPHDNSIYSAFDLNNNPS